MMNRCIVVGVVLVSALILAGCGVQKGNQVEIPAVKQEQVTPSATVVPKTEGASEDSGLPPAAEGEVDEGTEVVE
jgi:PBP1b-binding outer membrane lipoprotein LpoB